MSNDTKHHFLARKIQDFQRSTARGYVCPACTELFQQEPKLWQHAKSSHPGSLGYTDPAGEAEARKQFRQEAIDRAYVVSRCLHVLRNDIIMYSPRSLSHTYPISDRLRLTHLRFQAKELSQNCPSPRTCSFQALIERRRLDQTKHW